MGLGLLQGEWSARVRAGARLGKRVDDTQRGAGRAVAVSNVIIGCDNIAQLEENVRIAREFTPLSQAQMAAITKQAAPIANQALFFRSETRPREVPPTCDE